MKSLPCIQFDLPEWEEKHFQILRQAEKSMGAISHKAGKGSDEFMQACRRLLEEVLNGRGNDVTSNINKTIDVRAFTFLLSSSSNFAQKITISRHLLDHILAIRSPISRLTLTQLIRSFFVQFDRVADEQGLIDWCEFIKGNLAHYSGGSSSSELKRYAEHSDIIFSPVGPSRVIKYSQKEKIDFDGMLKRLGLTGFAEGRFLTLCRYQYYLNTLEQIPVGEDHPVLSEVCKTDVVNSPYAADKQLGHEILSILIDRSEGQAISQSWLNVILTIAGDPRVPKSSSNYQQWWALLGDKRIALMRGWLSRFDLKLFLKVLEQSAKDGKESDMERMFESRKVFMEGLLEEGLVSESRLFLSANAVTYLKKHYEPDELPVYAKVSSLKTSMIYLNLKGAVHIVEGSHSFKLKMFDRLPSECVLNNYSVKKVEDYELRSGILSQYTKEFLNTDNVLGVTHDVHLNWQNNAIQYLRKNGLYIEIGKLISKKRYREYKYKFGVN